MANYTMYTDETPTKQSMSKLQAGSVSESRTEKGGYA